MSFYMQTVDSFSKIDFTSLMYGSYSEWTSKHTPYFSFFWLTCILPSLSWIPPSARLFCAKTATTNDNRTKNLVISFLQIVRLLLLTGASFLVFSQLLMLLCCFVAVFICPGREVVGGKCVCTNSWFVALRGALRSGCMSWTHERNVPKPYDGIDFSLPFEVRNIF